MHYYYLLKKVKTYPHIGLFGKLPYPRIRILPIPIRVSVPLFQITFKHPDKLLEVKMYNIFVSNLGGLGTLGLYLYLAEDQKSANP